MSVVPYASFLIIVGSYLKRFYSYIDLFPKCFILIFSFMVTLTVSYFWKLDMAWNNIIPVVPLTICAIAGTVMTFICSSIIVKSLPMVSSVFQYIGRETFVIVAFSQMIIIFCNTHITYNPIIKYLILLISLQLIIYVKNRVFNKYGDIIHIKFGS